MRLLFISLIVLIALFLILCHKYNDVNKSKLASIKETRSRRFAKIRIYLRKNRHEIFLIIEVLIGFLRLLDH